MSPSDRWTRFARWVSGPRGLMVFAVSLLFAVMTASFVNIPWPSPPPDCGGALCEIQVVEGPTEQSISKTLFGPYAILVILIALVLAVCMIGGVYLAKAEGGGRP
ncbi:MAG: NADH-quinone oxidoreductase subunit J [Euryarchaeota archaeon]|nr:NADH-quinone oxidoreductase subunit J [Euryarchaeota archaeon]